MSVDIVYGSTVRDDVSIESPVVPKYVLEQSFAGAARFSVGPVIGSHNGSRFALHNTLLERGQISFCQVFFADNCIEMVTICFGTAMHCEVLWRSYDFQVFGIISLQALNKAQSHFAC